MCCSGPAWKRERVPDHKFDFINIEDYHSKAFTIRLQYLWVYILVIKSFLVYISDIYTATTMITSTTWSNKIFESCKEKNGCIAIDFKVARWLFVGCIIFSFLLLAYESHKAKKIIASRDISFAFTNIKAQNYYSLRSYDYFCFFCHINDSTKKKDDFAFFIFFTFKEWKRLLLADAPRQTINALILWSFYLAKSEEPGKFWDLSKYFDSKDMVTNVLLVAILFTVLICAGSILLLFIAAILYVPLLCYIQGNLKEYCCHKIDKRISELVERKRRQRIAKAAQMESVGELDSVKGKKGGGRPTPLPQPTLPSISLDDDDDLKKREHDMHYATSVRTANDSYWTADPKESDYNGGAYMPDYPPMPAYDHNAYPPQPGYTTYNSSLYGPDDGSLYDYDGTKGFIQRGTTPVSRGTTPANAAQNYARDQRSDRYTPDSYSGNVYARSNSYQQDQLDTTYNAYQGQQGYEADGYGAQQRPQRTYEDAQTYQQNSYQRTPSRNMPSRNGTAAWADQGYNTGSSNRGDQQYQGY